MEKVILVGTGKMLNVTTETMRKMNKSYFDITELWDNDVNKQGNMITINDIEYEIMESNRSAIIQKNRKYSKPESIELEYIIVYSK